MKAAVVTKNHTVDIQDKVLRPLKHGEAALKMECCGVCHTDLHVKNGDFGEVPGITLGHEGIGVVSAVGEGVTSLKWVTAPASPGFTGVAAIANTASAATKPCAVR